MYKRQILSYYFNLAPGGSMILTAVCLLIAVLVYKAAVGKGRKRIPKIENKAESL